MATVLLAALLLGGLAAAAVEPPAPADTVATMVLQGASGSLVSSRNCAPPGLTERGQAKKYLWQAFSKVHRAQQRLGGTVDMVAAGRAATQEAEIRAILPGSIQCAAADSACEVPDSADRLGRDWHSPTHVQADKALFLASVRFAVLKVPSDYDAFCRDLHQRASFGRSNEARCKFLLTPVF